MVRAGDVPLDRAHAHARWAGRYDAQGDQQRAAAHFGRAMHYAHEAHAFGDPKRAREAGMGDIVVGRWEDGAEVWTALYSERTKRSRMQQVHRGHGDTGIRKAKATTEGFVGSAHRELPDVLDKLYESEISGTKDSVHSYTGGTWYITRCATTGRVYLVPALHAQDEGGVRTLVRTLLSNSPLYTYAMRMYGLLVVQDLRPGCVRVKRTEGAWRAATEIETFAYYDFLLEYPKSTRYYHFGKKARELDYELSNPGYNEAYKIYWKSHWATVPREYAAANEDEDLQLTVRRNRGGISIGDYDDPDTNMSQISDWAWRLPS
jgi:hypothetical protein